jgi:hypothetical protein
MFSVDRYELERARDLLAAGNLRQARAICSTLGADILPKPRVPRCAWVAKLLSGPEPRLAEAEAEIAQLLNTERTGWTLTITRSR